MKVLLDSHTLIWLYGGNERLSLKAKEFLKIQSMNAF